MFMAGSQDGIVIVLLTECEETLGGCLRGLQ